jgi:hypothetical protein
MKVAKPDDGNLQVAGGPYRIRLPGFGAEQDVGLGDLIKRATSLAGVRPCGSCQRRSATLNSWLVFSGRRPT